MATVEQLQGQVLALQEQTASLTERLATVAAFADAADSFWALLGAILVFFMQCGFALLEAGAVRSKTTQNILLKNLVDACMGGIIWYLIGFPLAFGGGEDGNPFIGSAWESLVGSEPNWAFWMFSWAFAATAATIVSGAVAERCEFFAYLCYTTVLTAIVVAHWGWSSAGWLFKMGFHDFGGSAIVHALGGAAALVAAIFIGPRIGRFAIGEDGKWYTKEIRGHSTTLCTMGVFILWFGWYGFNPASTLSFALMKVSARVAVTTTLSACSGGLCCLVIDVLHGNMPSVAPTLNGILAGLVGITGACAVVEPYASIIIGLLAAPVYFYSSKLLQKLRIDDPLDASPVHFFCGSWGAIAVGLFGTKKYQAEYLGIPEEETADFAGLFYGGNGKQLGVQLAGLVAIAAWSISLCTVMFAVLKYTNKLRVKPEDERVGLDVSHHGGPAYDMRHITDEGSTHATPTRVTRIGASENQPVEIPLLPHVPPASCGTQNNNYVTDGLDTARKN